MRLTYYIMLAGALALSASCQKELEVKDAPDFSVTLDSTSYKVNTPVVFNIEGSADIISFYSGELFNDYAYREGRELDVSGKGVNVSFKSGIAPGSPPGTQDDQFSVLLSTDFSGDYSSLNSVKTATWKDITDSFTLGSNSTTLIDSDTLDITPFMEEGKPIYFALKYINKPQVVNGFARQWLVENFTINSADSLSNGGQIVISDQSHMGFRILDENPENAPARSSVTTSRVTLYGPVYKNPADPIFDPDNPVFDPQNPIYNPDSTAYVPGAQLPVYVPYDPNSPYNDPKSENWAVSGPIAPGIVELGKDKALIVRSSVYTAKPTTYKYTYSKPGTYKAYFLGTNNTINERKQTVKEIEVIIRP